MKQLRRVFVLSVLSLGLSACAAVDTWVAKVAGVGKEPNAFAIQKVLGSDLPDSNNVIYGVTLPSVEWTQSLHAVRYLVKVTRESDGAVVCTDSVTTNSALLANCLLDDGVIYKISVIASDAAGKTTKSSTEPRFAFDQTNPSVGFSLTPLATLRTSNATFGFSGSDTGSGVDRIECRIDSGAYTPCSSPYTPSGFSDGPHTLDIKSYDKAGRVSSIASSTWTVALASQLVFTTAPSASNAAATNFATQPVIQIRDAGGALVTTGPDATATVTLSLQTGTGALAGTVSVAAVGGIADFSAAGLSLNLSGTNKILRATKSSMTSSAGAGAITNDTSALTVVAGPATSFTIDSHPNPSVAGTSQMAILTAFDAQGNIATGYTGTVHLTSTDPSAILPTNYTFLGADAGTKTITGFQLRTAGTRTITATDTVTSSITASQTAISITPATPSSVTSTISASRANAPSDDVETITFTMTLLDAYSNPVPAQTVTLAATGTGNTLVQPAATTDASGQTTATLKSSIGGAKTVSFATPAALAALNTVVTFIAPTISVAAATSYRGSDLVFTITQSVARLVDTTVTYATSNGTATAGTHYPAKTGTATITAGATSTTVNVVTLNDGSDYTTKTVTMTLSSPSSPVALATASNTGTITDASLLLDFMTGTLPAAGLTFAGPSGASYYNSSGLMVKTSNTTTPRYDYNPITGDLNGLLVEPRIENFALKTESFDDGIWTASVAGLKSMATNSNVAATTAPDGTQTAELLQEDGSAGLHSMTSVTFGSLFAGKILAFSIHVKPAPGAYRQIYLQFFNGSDIVGGLFDPGNCNTTYGGDISGNATFSRRFSQMLPNGWCRITLVGKLNTTTTSAQISISLYSGSTLSYTGNNTSGMYIWGAQLEPEPIPTSYFANNSYSIVGRDPDALYMPTSASGGAWMSNTSLTATSTYSASAYTYGAVDYSGGGVWTEYPGFSGLRNTGSGATSIFPTMYLNGLQTFGNYLADSVNWQSVTGVTARTANLGFQLAHTVDVSPGGRVQIAENGVGQTASTTPSAPATTFIDELDIAGAHYWDRGNFPRHVKKYAFRPYAVAQTVLESLSSLFVSGLATNVQSTVTFNQASATANGSAVVLVIVTLKDSTGKPVQGKTVTLSSSRGVTDFISGSSGPTDAYGKAVFTVRSSTAGVPIFTGYCTSDSVTVSSTAFNFL